MKVMRAVAGSSIAIVSIVSAGKALQLGLTSYPASDIALWMINSGIWLLALLV